MVQFSSAAETPQVQCVAHKPLSHSWTELPSAGSTGWLALTFPLASLWETERVLLTKGALLGNGL